jgi:predicted AlkP superfamily phosphohydrolase/phosphomutase
MTARLLAIGIDAGEPAMIRSLMARGKLPHMRRLVDEGAWADIESSPYYVDESTWTVFLSGHAQTATGFWTSLRLQKGSYRVQDTGSYDFRTIPQFFEYAGDRKIAIFDVPHSNTLWKQINGLHVIGWGAHFLPAVGCSVPGELYDSLVSAYGRYPAADLQYMGLNWWDTRFLEVMREALFDGIAARVKICTDLLQRENWDLFLTVFPEVHNGSHHFEHLCNPNHPIWPGPGSSSDTDPMVSLYEKLDRAIGDLLAAAGEEACAVVFSIQGHGINCNDLPGLVFVPECLFRLNFPNRTLFPRGDPAADCPPILRQLAKSMWPSDMWERRSDSWFHRKVLSPFTDKVIFPGSEGGHSGTLSAAAKLPGRILEGLRRRLACKAQGFAPSDPVWNPALWYQRWWPEMRAFALPSYADGYVRVNIKGREPSGVVNPLDYNRECERISTELRSLTDSRTGKRLVADIWKPRSSALDDDPLLPDADLVVICEDFATDAVQSPSCGRIGPVPYLRTGGPRSKGFFVAQGPGIGGPQGVGTVRVIDLPRTVLDLMGVSVGKELEGIGFLEKSTTA